VSECILRVRLRWVVAPCHSPRLLAYAHLFPFQQELTSGLWAAYSASRCYSREDSPALYRSTLRIACLHSTIAVFVPLLHCLSNLVYIIDNQLTWQRILPEKLVVPHLIKKFRAFKVKKKKRLSLCTPCRLIEEWRHNSTYSYPRQYIKWSALRQGCFSGESSVSHRIGG